MRLTVEELRLLLTNAPNEAEMAQLRAENSRLLQRLQEAQRDAERSINPRMTAELTAAIAARDHNAQQLDEALDAIDKHKETIDTLRARLREKKSRRT